MTTVVVVVVEEVGTCIVKSSDVLMIKFPRLLLPEDCSECRTLVFNSALNLTFQSKELRAEHP